MRNFSKFMILALTAVAAPSHATEIFCFNHSGHDWVRIDSNTELSSISYGRADDELLLIRMRGELIRQAGPDRFVVNTGFVSLGESNAQVYGRFGPEGTLFDIYRFGFHGNLNVTSQDFECREVEP